MVYWKSLKHAQESERTGLKKASHNHAVHPRKELTHFWVVNVCPFSAILYIKVALYSKTCLVFMFNGGSYGS